MAKRKLSTQQKRRISEKRNVKTDQEEDLTTESQTGLVITNFGKRVLIEAEDGVKFKCSIRQHLGKLAAGDRVIWQKDQEPFTGVIGQLQERKTLLSRPGFRGEIRMIAANISLIGIVVPILPGIHPDMIDRYLVASEQIGIPSFIILNKDDLVEEEDHWEAIEEILKPYNDLKIPIILTSSYKDHGLDDLQNKLINQTSVFVGASGAGKSSLINALIPDLEIRVGELSEATGLGSHTTSNSILYHLPNGGDLIDSPGVRQFTPKPCSLSELEQFYHDFEPFLDQCKFSNCTHTHEPGCAMIKAVENDQISAQRLQSFHRLLEEFEG
jgi:ribosome biogenesis GTPase